MQDREGFGRGRGGGEEELPPCRVLTFRHAAQGQVGELAWMATVSHSWPGIILIWGLVDGYSTQSHQSDCVPSDPLACKVPRHKDTSPG